MGNTCARVHTKNTRWDRVHEQRHVIYRNRHIKTHACTKTSSKTNLGQAADVKADDLCAAKGTKRRRREMHASVCVRNGEERNDSQTKISYDNSIFMEVINI